MARRKKQPAQRPALPADRPQAAEPGPDSRPWLTMLFGALVVASAGLLYASTAARDIIVGDTPELIAAAATLGVPHAPGYPLVTMIGHLFSLLPTGPIPFRVNLMAVTLTAMAVGVVYATTVRLTADRVSSAAAALVLATSPVFWEWAVAAEVFCLSNLLASTLILLLVVWQRRPERMSTLVAAAAVGGLALSNQQTVVLLGPAILFLLWRERKRLLERREVLAACIAAVALGWLLPYVYVPFASAREPVVNWGGVRSLGDLVDLILRRSYGTGQLTGSAEFIGGSPVERVVALLGSYGPLAGSLFVLGLVQAYRRQRWYFWFALIAFAVAGPAFVAYASINLANPTSLFVLERFFLLSYIVLAPLAAFGIQLAAEALAAATPPLRERAVAMVAAVVVVAAVAVGAAHYREIDQSRNHVARTLAEDIFATLEPNTILFASGDHIVLPLMYLQAVENHRPDVTLVLAPLLPGDWYVRQLKQRNPDLRVPFDHYDGPDALKALIDENSHRRIAVAGPLTDSKGVSGSYWFHQYGLVSLVEPMSKDVSISELAADSERLMAGYHPPSPDAIKAKTFERNILSNYAAPAYRVASEYEKAGKIPEARAWYRRALTLAPELAQAQEGLARVGN